MGSWEEILYEQLIDTGNLEAACIFGQDGACWAKSPYFSSLFQRGHEESSDVIDESILNRVLVAFEDPNYVYSEGFQLLDNNYTVTMATHQLIGGKKGFNGLYIVKTSQAIVFAVYNMYHQPGEALLTIEKFYQYLHEQDL
jgi:profilin